MITHTVNDVSTTWKLSGIFFFFFFLAKGDWNSEGRIKNFQKGGTKALVWLLHMQEPFQLHIEEN